MAVTKLFTKEADLVAAFGLALGRARAPSADWTEYHETAGWDLLLVNPVGVQIGIEAKLALNPKVLEQALPGRWGDRSGPDYRAVLVPQDGLQHHTSRLAHHLGIVVITLRSANWRSAEAPWDFSPSLPDEAWDYSMSDWPNWCPAERCGLPDYVPDVRGGHAAPVQLSPWKIKAIRLLILLERNGSVTRADMKALGISPTRWTDHWNGFLSPGPSGGYVRNTRTPDLRAQHPENWPQIEADFATWSKGCGSAGLFAKPEAA